MQAFAQPAIPNFFLVGAPKAGSTSLYHHLRQHPEIYMSPVKEPSYFASEIRLHNFAPELQARVRESSGLIDNWDDYLRLFASASDQKAVGEASVCYLWSQTAAQQIARVRPDAKLLIILRQPADRAFSQYLHALSDGAVSHPFRQHIHEGLRPHIELDLFHPFLEYGMYSAQVERCLAAFPCRNVRIFLYEETIADPAKFHREVLTFLGVDPEFTPDTSRRYHQMEVPRALGISQFLRRSGIWRALRDCVPPALRPWVKRIAYRSGKSIPMPNADRLFLLDYYYDDIRRLERVIQRDLSTWLR